MRKSLIQPSVTIPNLAGKKRHKTTVGSIVVPELPGYWPGRDGPDTRAMDLLREYDPSCVCPTCGHESGSLDYCDQVDCDCVDPFHCT